MPDSVVSIDSPSSSEYSYDPEEDARAQEEWEESVQEIQRLFSAILLPYLGKYFGRSFSYWGK
jgi:Mitochondrial import 2